jgi:hypothetical protein
MINRSNDGYTKKLTKKNFLLIQYNTNIISVFSEVVCVNIIGQSNDSK